MSKRTKPFRDADSLHDAIAEEVFGGGVTRSFAHHVLREGMRLIRYRGWYYLPDAMTESYEEEIKQQNEGGGNDQAIQ